LAITLSGFVAERAKNLCNPGSSLILMGRSGRAVPFQIPIYAIWLACCRLF
jgi:hypothetical protein